MINRTSYRYATSDINGVFKIQAKLSDTLYFSSVQYIPKTIIGQGVLIKNFSIELSRTNKLAKVIGLHPGTVDTQLSKPFQRNVSENKLFSPEFAASSMAAVIDNLADNESGSVFAFDGSKIDS